MRQGVLRMIPAAACACACLMATAAPATATLPIYDGFLDFPNIKDASGPEEFSWEVIVGKGQELRQIDDQLAEVIYPEDETIAATIFAQPAHDATGAAVPTSLEVSEGDVVTLFVHHRAGNPLTGQPFVYPVVDGPGFETGFETVRAFIPPPEAPDKAPKEEAADKAPRKGQVGGPPTFKLGPPGPPGIRTSPELVIGTGRTINGPIQLVAYGWNWKSVVGSAQADFCVGSESLRLREGEFGTCGTALNPEEGTRIAIDHEAQAVAPRSARATTIGGRISRDVAAVRVYFHRPGSGKLHSVSAIVGQVSGNLQQRLEQPAPFGFFYAEVHGLVRFKALYVQALGADGSVIGRAHGLTPQSVGIDGSGAPFPPVR